MQVVAITNAWLMMESMKMMIAIETNNSTKVKPRLQIG
jgi:biotin carboxyl carrier protein